MTVPKSYRSERCLWRMPVRLALMPVRPLAWLKQRVSKRTDDKMYLQKLLRDSTLAGLGAGLSRLFLFTLNILVARTVVDPATFGVFSSVYLAVQVVEILSSLGLSQTASRSIGNTAHDPERQRQTTRTIVALLFGVAVLASAVLLVGAPLISRWLRGDVPTAALRVGAAVVFVYLLAGGLEGVLRGLHRFAYIPLATGTAGVIGILLAFPLVRAHGIYGGLAALFVFLLTQVLVSLSPFAARLAGPRLPLRETRTLLGLVAAPTFLSGLAWNFAMMIPPFMLVRSAFGLEHMALWNASSQLRFFITFAPIVLVNTSIPHLSKLHGEGKLRRGHALTSVGLAMGAAVLTYLPVALLAGPLLSLYGAAYAAHARLLVLVASFVLLQVLGVGLYGVILATGRVWQASLLNCAWCLAVLLSAPYCIAHNGAYGLAWLYLVSYVPVLAVLAVLALRALQTIRKDAAGVVPMSE